MATVADAGTVKGKVVNGTTGKPAASVEVILIQLQGGMQPVATRRPMPRRVQFREPGDRAQPDAGAPVYKGVNFHQAAATWRDSVT